MKALLLTLIISATLSAQPAPNPGRDLNGWSTISWGMTVAQARAALPAATDPTETPGPNFTLIDRLILPGIHIGTIATGPIALQSAPGTDAISAVHIRAADLDEQPANRAAISAVHISASSSRNTPAPKTSRPSRPAETAPRAPSCGSSRTPRSTLTWHESSRFGLGYVSLTYQARDQKALDVL